MVSWLGQEPSRLAAVDVANERWVDVVPKLPPTALSKQLSGLVRWHRTSEAG